MNYYLQSLEIAVGMEIWSISQKCFIYGVGRVCGTDFFDFIKNQVCCYL